MSHLPSMSHLYRRTALLIALGLTLGLAAPIAAAQAQTPAWPAKPVRIVNSFPAGGPSDILARELAQALQEASKQTVIVENKPGASGNVAADLLAKSPGDGGMVLVGIDTTFTVNPHIYKPMPFAAGDLKPLVIISSNGLLLGTTPAVGTGKLPDFLKLAQTRNLNFSSGGNGSPGHLAVEVLADAAKGSKVTHIPYKGNAPAVNALVAAEVDAGILSVSGMLPHVRTGKIVPVAMTSRTRSKALPDVPTVGELGYPALQSEVITLAMVPASTPEPLLQAMQKAVLDALAKPQVRARIQGLDMEYEGLTGSAAAQRLQTLHDRYGPIVRATGMKVD